MKIVDINGSNRDCVDAMVDPQFPGFVKVDFISKLRNDQKHSEWYPIKDFIANNPDLKKIVSGKEDIQEEDLGIVSSASSLSITDKRKKWKDNIFAGRQLWISRGTGEGQTRNVLQNTEDTIIIDKKWEETPDKSSQYVISDNVHNPQIMGNTLPGFPAKVEKISKSSKSKKK